MTTVVRASRRRFSTVGSWLLAAGLVFGAQHADAARIKDITSIAGVETVKVIGVGLVDGLAGTGDQTTNVPFARQMIRTTSATAASPSTSRAARCARTMWLS